MPATMPGGGAIELARRVTAVDRLLSLARPERRVRVESDRKSMRTM